MKNLKDFSNFGLAESTRFRRLTFRGKQLEVSFAWYDNKRTAIELYDSEGERYAVASVNLVDEDLEPDEIAIKDYSENEGMADALAKAGIVSEPVRWVQSGFVKIPICKLLTTNNKTK